MVAKVENMIMPNIFAKWSPKNTGKI